ncbi:MAG: hypothetical protein HFJ26_04640 [Clostridia bacterium]|nr:hypothetical protein [Clostridia bacterium]
MKIRFTNHAKCAITVVICLAHFVLYSKQIIPIKSNRKNPKKKVRK